MYLISQFVLPKNLIEKPHDNFEDVDNQETTKKITCE